MYTADKEDHQIMTTNITPLHDRVIVKRIDEGEQVRGGIIIPDSAKEKPQEGEVIAAGAGKYKEDGTRQPLDVKAGDRILFGKYTSSEIKIDGEELLIMREDEILGIISRAGARSEEHTSELQSRLHLVCRLLLEKKKIETLKPARGGGRRGNAGSARQGDGLRVRAALPLPGPAPRVGGRSAAGAALTTAVGPRRS